VVTHVRVGGCCERDIDLLLLEEFVSSPNFCRWFLESTSFPEACAGKVSWAERSATASNGESDLEVMLECSDGSCYRILIENKVAAGFQPSTTTLKKVSSSLGFLRLYSPE
jgi:hypothetical protein